MRSRNQRSWRDHQHAAGELEQRLFQRAQRFHVEVVGRLVEQQHVAALEQRLGQVQAAALAARELPDELLLVAALEVEAADVGARRISYLPTVRMSRPPEIVLPHGLACRRALRVWSTNAIFTVWPMLIVAGVGLLLARDHAEQRRLAGAVRADDADDGAGAAS